MNKTPLKLAVMQPYFLPYIGYFQLIAAVDIFIIYDNIKYTKKGWINRNRMLQNGKDELFTLPLKSDSDFLDVNERYLSADFQPKKLLSQISNAYRKAPYFVQIIELLGDILIYQDNNLFNFIHHSLQLICKSLEIETKILVSSELVIDHELKGQDKVLAISEALSATHYINAIGGIELYDKKAFALRGIDLSFIKSNPIEYMQFENVFVPWLSILDVMMFNSTETIQNWLVGEYKLL